MTTNWSRNKGHENAELPGGDWHPFSSRRGFTNLIKTDYVWKLRLIHVPNKLNVLKMVLGKLWERGGRKTSKRIRYLMASL